MSEPRSRQARMRALAEVPRFSIEAVLVYPERLLVERNGDEFKLDLRQMELLVALASKPGEEWSKNALMEQAWGTAVFTDSMLHKNMSILRDALGDDPKSPTCIQSLPKMGYRLIGQVRGIDNRLLNRLKAPNWAGLNPYVGLAAFDGEHEDVFFGREDLIKRVHKALRTQRDNGNRFVLIVGSSGCGKTSLLQAGVLPPMIRKDRADGLQALSVARCDFAAAQPGELLQHLAAALRTWQLDGRTVFAEPSAALLADTLAARPEASGAAIDDAWLKWPARQREAVPDNAHLLLTIDHAEALVGRGKDEADNTQSDTDRAQERAQVEATIVALCAHPCVTVIAVVRGDFYAQLADAMPILMTRKGGEGHVDVPLPQPAEITQMIRGPATIARLTFEQRPEDGARLDDVLRDATIGQPDALPLLQHTLAALCDARDGQDTLTFAAYDALGGLEGALKQRAEQVFQGLPGHVQQQLDTVLSLLIRLDGDTERVRGRSVLWTMLPDDPTRALVNAFINARLFVSGGSESKPDFHVAHEALLRQWPRAREWIEDNRRLLLAHARLERAAARWSELGNRDDLLLNSGQPLGEALEVQEKFGARMDTVSVQLLARSRRQHRIRRLTKTLAILALAVLAIAASATGVVARSAQKDAEQERERKERLLEYMLVSLADELRSCGNLGVLESIAVEASKSLGKKDLAGMSRSEVVNHARALRTTAEVYFAKERVAEANESLQLADDAIQVAIRDHEINMDIRRENGFIQYWQGYSAYISSDPATAKREWTHYLSNSREMSEMEKNNPEWMREESYALHSLATLELGQGRPAQAIPLLQKSLDLKERAFTMNADKKHEKDIIDTMSLISTTQETTGEPKAALAGYDIQIQRARQLIETRNEANAWRLWLANALVRRALLNSHMKSVNHESRDLDEALSILGKLVDLDPENLKWARDFARAHMVADEIKFRTDPASYSEHHLDAALILANNFGNKKNSPKEWVRMKALISLRKTIQSHTSTHRLDAISACVERLEHLHAASKGDLGGTLALAESLIARAIEHRREKNTDAAQSDLRRAHDLLAPHAESIASPRFMLMWITINYELERDATAKKAIASAHQDGLLVPHAQ